MPSILDTPEHIDDIDLHDLPSAHPGFWHTLTRYLVWPHAQQPHRRQRSCAIARPQTMETPVELWARQYPKLYLQAFAGQ
jgi:hypothetical protein